MTKVGQTKVHYYVFGLQRVIIIGGRLKARKLQPIPQ